MVIVYLTARDPFVTALTGREFWKGHIAVNPGWWSIGGLKDPSDCVWIVPGTLTPEDM